MKEPEKDIKTRRDKVSKGRVEGWIRK